MVKTRDLFFTRPCIGQDDSLAVEPLVWDIRIPWGRTHLVGRSIEISHAQLAKNEFRRKFWSDSWGRGVLCLFCFCRNERAHRFLSAAYLRTAGRNITYRTHSWHFFVPPSSSVPRGETDQALHVFAVCSGSWDAVLSTSSSCALKSAVVTRIYLCFFLVHSSSRSR